MHVARAVGREGIVISVNLGGPEVLRVLLAGEVTGRDAATRRMRRKTAGFPAGKTFSSWRAEESCIPGR